jgi:NADP-dependent 3-hydroxy acid dehydrogenase YdfG
MDLKNKTVVVTGASDGIGKHVALKLAEQGVSLALVARNEERLSEVKSKCLELGSPKVETYVCDISQKENVRETVARIISDFKAVDVLLNIAGVWQKLNPLENITDEEIESVLDINLKGLIFITRALMPSLKKDTESIIINVSSRSGVVAVAGESVYSASKWGVTGFTEVLKADFKGTKIRVAGVYQGGTNTKLFDKAGDIKTDEKLKSFIQPEDLADVIVFMLSRPPQIWLHDVRVEY